MRSGTCRALPGRRWPRPGDCSACCEPTPGQDPRQPQPGLADLDDLLARVRAAGLPVRYERTGTAADLPTGVQLAVFRLVQEALTNTMKHAGPRASAAVRLRCHSGEVSVDIEDDGAGGSARARRRGRRPDRHARANQGLRR